MSKFGEILEYCKAEAIACKFKPTEESIYRSLCRDYSKYFNTPLARVLKLDPIHVVLNVYEQQLDNWSEETLNKFETLEELYETIMRIKDPNYDELKEKEIADEMERYEAEEEERLKAGKAIHPALRKQPELVPDDKPKEGSISFDQSDKET